MKIRDGVVKPETLNISGQWPGPWEMEWVDLEGTPHPFRRTKVGEARRAMKAWLADCENWEVVKEKSGEMLRSVEEVTPEVLGGMEELRRIAEERMRPMRPTGQQGRVALAFLGELVNGILTSASAQMARTLRQTNTRWEPRAGSSRDDDAQDVLEWLFRR